MELLIGQAEVEAEIMGSLVRQIEEILNTTRCVCCEKNLYDCRCTPDALAHWERNHPAKVLYRPMRRG
jgi:hypothetical protein